VRRLFVLCNLALLAIGPILAEANHDPKIWGISREEGFGLTSTAVERVAGTTTSSKVGSVLSDVVYQRRDQLCGGAGRVGDALDCAIEALETFRPRGCEGTDDFAVNPRFVDGVEDGEVVSTEFLVGDCAGDLAVPAVVVTLKDFAALDLAGSGITVEPDLPGGVTQGIINLPVNVFTSDRAQLLRATVLGQSVRVRAVPVSYVVDWGDGETTGPVRDPGSSGFDEGALQHVYSVPGSYRITLVTSWRGSWSVDGVVWTRIVGEVETRDVTGEFTQEERKPVLIN